MSPETGATMATIPAPAVIHAEKQDCPDGDCEPSADSMASEMVRQADPVPVLPERRASVAGAEVLSRDREQPAVKVKAAD